MRVPFLSRLTCRDRRHSAHPAKDVVRLGQSARVWRRVSLLTVACFLLSFVALPVAAAVRPPTPASRSHFHATPMTAQALARRIAQAEQAMRHHLAQASHGKNKPGLPSLAEMIRRDALRQAKAAPVSKKTLPPAPQALLDEAGQMGRFVTPATLAAWKTELHRGNLAPRRAASLHLWLGEYLLAHDEHPQAAYPHFRQAQALTTKKDPIYGRAAYDTADGLFYQGAYAEAADRFARLLDLRTALPGYDRADCALWLKHARACAGYHADRAKQGIPEPPQLDPLCGAAALAACLHGLNRRADKKTVLSACKVTGLGSTLADVVAAGPKLGVSIRTLTATDEGLIALPKPLVSFVEDDHFIAVVGADKRGVTYLCSDCGPWPGGRVRVSWAQWHLLSPGLYAAVTLPGSRWDQRLAAQDQSTQIAGSGVPDFGVQVAMALGAQRVLPWMPAFPALKGVQVRPAATKIIGCGLVKGFSKHCKPHVNSPTHSNANARVSSPGAFPCGAPQQGDGDDAIPTDDPGSGGYSAPVVGKGGGCGGPGAGDPVNIATGEEEYAPGDDLSVYNPHGPSIGWRRVYGSLRSFEEQADNGPTYTYEQADFGYGWSHPYNMFVIGNPSGSMSYLVLPGGGRISFIAPAGVTPTQGSPVQCQVERGAPMLVEWDYDGTASGFYTVTWPDRGRWLLKNEGSQNGSVTFYQLDQIVDRNGNAVTFHYQPASSFPTSNSNSWPVLSSITNKDNTKLLTLSRNSRGEIVAASDCYGRSVYYHVGQYGAGRALDWVSQLVPTCTPSPAARYTYGYQTVMNGEYAYIPYLHTITVPSPTGTGTSTALINYDPNTLFVSSLTDANGNSHSFSAVDDLHERVTISDPQGSVAYTYVDGYDNNMSATTETDGAGRPLFTILYSDPNDPYRPSAVLDGNASATHVNPVGRTGATLILPDIGQDAPAVAPTASTPTWDVAAPGGAVVASSSQPNGWTVSDSSAMSPGKLTIQSPGGTPAGNGYEARSAILYSGHVIAHSAFFDLISASASFGTTHYTWDQFGQMTSRTTPRGTTTVYTWDYSHFALGELRSVQEGRKTAVTFSYLDSSASDYTNSGLVQSVNGPLPGTVGAPLPAIPTAAYQYDTYGNVTSVTTRGNNAATTITTTMDYGPSPKIGQPLTVTDALGKASHLSYDSQGNPLGSVDANSNETDTIYNIANQPQAESMPATGQTGTGHVTVTPTYLYPGGPVMSVTAADESGNPVRQVNAGYGLEGEILSVSGSTEPVSVSYDAAYRHKTLTDGNSHTTRYAYNAAGYLATVSYPGANGATTGPDTINFTAYDPNGNVLSRTDGRGIVTNYGRSDPESALTDVQYPASTGLNVHVAYDGYGRATAKTDGAGSYTYVYDDLGAPTSIQTTYVNQTTHTNLPTKTLSYAYYSDGRRSSMNTPAGAFAYRYDGVGRLSSLTNPFSEISSWQYLDNGWLRTQALGNGVTTTYTLNNAGVITQLTNQNGTTLLSNFGGMTYDGVYNRTAVTATMPAAPMTYGGTTSYSYDSKDQLLQEQSSRSNSYNNTFVFDPAGNPTTSRSVSGNTFNSDNQIVGNGYGYDGNGNPTYCKSQSLTFDVENRLTAYGSTMSATYMSTGLRACKQSSVGSTYFLYDSGRPICELDGNGNLSAVNTFGRNGLLSRHTRTGSVFYTFDERDNVIQRVSETGSVLSSDQYDGFGNRQTTDTTQDAFGFCGQWGNYTDSETNLCLMTHRYYDPAIGRFLTRDPIGYAGGINLYAYCQNGPINYADPYGTFRLSVPKPIQDVVDTIETGVEDATGEVGAGVEATGSVGIEIGFGPILFVSGVMTLALQTPAGPYQEYPPSYYKMGRGKTRENLKDSGLEGESDADVTRKSKDKSLSSEERKRYTREDKVRKHRNKKKRC